MMRDARYVFNLIVDKPDICLATVILLRAVIPIRIIALGVCVMFVHQQWLLSILWYKCELCKNNNFYVRFFIRILYLPTLFIMVEEEKENAFKSNRITKLLVTFDIYLFGHGIYEK